MHRIVEPLLNAVFDQQPVDNHFDRVVAPLVEFDLFIQLANLAVDANTVKSRSGKFLDFLFEFALPPANDWSEYHHALAFGQRRHLLDDLIDRLARDRPATFWTMRQTD